MTTPTMTLGLMADPGLPEQLAAALAADLGDKLSREAEAAARWEVEVSRQSLPITPDGQIPLMAHAQALRDSHGWDCLVYLTDLLRSQEEEPLVCEVSSTARAAMICLPALGAYRLRAKARKLVVALFLSAQEGSEDFPSSPAARTVLGHKAARRQPVTGAGDTSYLVLPGALNRLRLLTGMVRSNQPGRLLTALSGCVAAAAATGAFGIFYAFIWNMSDALHPGRLAVISVVVISALSAWLIGSNGLWNRLRNATERWRARVDNAATVITVGLSVALMYVILWALLFGLGLAVIASDYLGSQLGHPADLSDYLHLSWLAASLGTLAGALGLNFDSHEAIREATYSRREHERRRLADDYGH